MITDSGFVGGPVKPPKNLGSDDIILEQQQPLMYHNHQPVPMESSQFLLTTNSNMSQPFNNNQVMTMINSALPSSSPRDNDLAYSIASLRNIIMSCRI